MQRRSVLFSPGDQRDKLEGALETPADVVVFDLEDGVAPDDKSVARRTVASVLAELASDPVPPVLVRINPLDRQGTDDLDELGSVDPRRALEGVVLPKVDAPSDIRQLTDLLVDVGLPRSVWCLLETPSGILEAAAIATVPGVAALIVGGEDYAASIGARRTTGGTELLLARQWVVLAAAHGGVEAIDGITPDLDDLDRVSREARDAATFGFAGKLAIHPAQVEPINEAFTPDEGDVAWARRVVEAADRSDTGVFRVDDEMIDPPLIKQARRILERAGESDP